MDMPWTGPWTEQGHRDYPQLRYRGLHRAPPRGARAFRAACRGAARVISFPAAIGHLGYRPAVTLSWT